MLELTLEGLIRAFGSQWADESKFVGILVDIAGVKEVIINSRENYEAKLEYYKNAYNDDLSHKHAKGISIIRFTFGNSFAEIQEDLLGGSYDEIYGRR